MEKEMKRKARRRKEKERHGTAMIGQGNEECRVVKQPKKIEKEKTVS